MARENLAWGVSVDPNCNKFDFLPAWKAGASFVVAQMNWGFQDYNPNWITVVDQPWKYQMPVVGVYNMEVAAYHRTIPDYGYYPLHDNIELENDKVWLDLVSVTENKGMQVLVIKFTNFLNDNGDPIPEAHVLAIVESAMKRVHDHIREVNHRIKVVVPMIDERVIREQYPSLGSPMGEEQYCFSDKQTQEFITNLPDWSDIENRYPPARVVGYDGEEHSDPPYAFTQGWWGWLWADYKFLNGDCTRILSNGSTGMGVMGAAFYNGTPEELFAQADVTPKLGDISGEPNEPPPAEPPVETPPEEPEVPPMPTACYDNEFISAEIDVIAYSLGVIADHLREKYE